MVNDGRSVCSDHPSLSNGSEDRFSVKLQNCRQRVNAFDFAQRQFYPVHVVIENTSFSTMRSNDFAEVTISAVQPLLSDHE